jgi:hypothetical protein
VGSRVIEEQRGGRAQASSGTEAVTQLDGHQRVEAKLLEGAARLDGLRGRVAQDGGHLGAHEIEQGTIAAFAGEGGEALLEQVRRAGESGAPRADAEETPEHGRQGVGLCAQSTGAEARWNEGGVGSDKGGVEERKALLG